MKKNNWLFMIMIFGLFASLLFGCSNEKPDSAEASGNSVDGKNSEEAEVVVKEFSIDEPVTLKMINWWSEEIFERWWKDPVEAKFPNVTLEQIQIQPEAEELDQLYASNDRPDLFIGHFDHVRTLAEYETTFDLTEMIEMYGFDTEKFIPGLIDQVKVNAPNDELYLLPFLVDRYVLHYNKDIFDRFGVDYPTDDMTYSDVLELAREVTGEQEGTNYYGMQWGWDSFNTVGAHLTALDIETLEPRFTTDNQWSEFFTLIKDMYNIPGNLPDEEEYQSYVFDRFEGDRSVAMVPLWFNPGLSEVNWDMVTYPTWEGFEDQVPGGVGFGVGITSFSEHKDEAFQVLAYLLSEEAVIDRYNDGDGGNIAHLVYHPHELGIDVSEDFEDVNVEALFKKDFIPLNKHFFENQVFYGTVIEEMTELLYGNIDVNTHLRQLTEKAEVLVEDLQAQQ